MTQDGVAIFGMYGWSSESDSTIDHQSQSAKRKYLRKHVLNSSASNARLLENLGSKHLDS